MCTENHYWHHDYVRLAWDSGFAFNTHRAKLNYDWSSLGLLDIDRIVRDRDVAIVEKHLGTVLNYCLDEDQTKILEPTFVKVFQLSQLSLQYLQFCKRYLDNTVILLKKELGRYKQENSNLKGSVDELKQEVDDLKKQLKELKVPTSQLACPESATSSSFKCSVCYKLFVSEEFLLAHFKRRHEIDVNPFQTETDRLQSEIKELKERLNSTEKYIQHGTEQKKAEIIPNNDAVIESSATYVDDLKDKFDHLKSYVEQELTVLRREKHYQEKYEKWFEMVFQRLDSSKNELQEKQETPNLTGDGDKLIRTESSTQTVTEHYVESETMTDEFPAKPAAPCKEVNIPNPIAVEIDVRKIQNNIRRNADEHFEQMQGALEKQLSGGFEQIQSKMNSFWKRLSDIELDKKSNKAVDVLQVNSASANVFKFGVDAGDQKSDSSVTHTSSSSESLAKPIPAPRIIRPAALADKKNKTEVKVTTPIEEIAIPTPAKATSSEDTSSEDSVEVLKSPIKRSDAQRKRPKSSTTYVKSAGRVAKQTFLSSETEEEKPRVKPQAKQSTSTLGQRSLTSLKQTMLDEDVIKGLNKELHEMVNARLREIGISPSWKGIPEKSYQQAIRVVKHQTDLSRRRYHNYDKIRSVLLKILSDRVKKQIEDGKYKIENKKQKKGKILVIKQPKPASKKHKKSKYTSNNTFLVNTDPENTRPKVDKHEKKLIENDAQQESATIPEDKITFVGQTPVKKKVLFDLKDSSSTSKAMVAGGADLGGIHQQGNQENKRSLMTPSPARKQEARRFVDAAEMLQVLRGKDGESSSSLGSSILEAPTGNRTKTIEDKSPIATKDDISDWDISDILT